MEAIFGRDWKGMFVPDAGLVEIFARGTITYLVLFTLLRLVLKRESAAVGVTDLLVLVLIADAAQNAMAGGYQSVPDGLFLVAVIVFWAWALDWLGFHVPFVARFVDPPALPLVEDGRLLRRNMRRELITEDELMSQLRLSGIEELEQVKRAYMEGDGGISVIRRDESGDRPRPRRENRRGV